MDIENNTQDNTLDRFSTLVRQAKLYRYLQGKVKGSMMASHPDSSYSDLQAKAEQAETRVAAYVDVCIAKRLHERTESGAFTFSPKIQEAFGIVSGMLDDHIRTGQSSREVRSGLLTAAERLSSEYAPGRQMRGSQKEEMEIGEELNKTKGLDRDFSVGDASALTWNYGRAQYAVLHESAVFRDRRDVIGLVRTQDAQDAAPRLMSAEQVRSEIDENAEKIAKWNDPTLRRLEDEQRERAPSVDSEPSEPVNPAHHEGSPAVRADGFPARRSRSASSELSDVPDDLPTPSAFRDPDTAPSQSTSSAAERDGDAADTFGGVCDAGGHRRLKRRKYLSITSNKGQSEFR